MTMGLIASLNPALRYLLFGLFLAVLLLGAGLVASIGLNVWLGYRLAGASERCKASQQAAVASALEDERKRSAKDEQTGAAIVQDARADRADAVTTAQGGTNARDVQIRTVVVHGECRMPDGLPALQPAVDAANAAAR